MMVAAALLTPETVTLTNMPDIADVRNMLACAKAFGAKVECDHAARTVAITAAKLRTARLDPELARKIRTSFLFAGPLLALAYYVSTGAHDLVGEPGPYLLCGAKLHDLGKVILPS